MDSPIKDQDSNLKTDEEKSIIIKEVKDNLFDNVIKYFQTELQSKYFFKK